MDIIGVYIGVYIADIITTATITIIVACITAIIGIGETYRVGAVSKLGRVLINRRVESLAECPLLRSLPRPYIDGVDLGHR